MRMRFPFATQNCYCSWVVLAFFFLQGIPCSGTACARKPLLRSIVQVVKGTRILREPGTMWEGDECEGEWRVIGDVEPIRGEGTGWSDCGPFLLVEEEVLPKDGKSTRGRVPFAGLCVVTIPLAGGATNTWTNLGGRHAVPLEVGGVQAINTGSGIVMSEDERLPSTDGGRAQVCRVWIDQGCGEGHHPLPYPQVVPPSLICNYNIGPGHTIKVYLGAIDGIAGPCDAWRSKVLLLEGTLEAGSPEDVIELPPSMTSAFVFVPHACGTGAFGRGRYPLSDGMAADISGEGKKLTVKNIGSTRLRYILGAGAPFGQGDLEDISPKTLVLSHGGGFAVKDEDDAREAISSFEGDPSTFGEYKPDLNLPKDGEWIGLEDSSDREPEPGDGCDATLQRDNEAFSAGTQSDGKWPIPPTPAPFDPTLPTPGRPSATRGATPYDPTPGKVNYRAAPTPGRANPAGPTPGRANPAGPTPGRANPAGPTPGRVNPAGPTPGRANYGERARY